MTTTHLYATREPRGPQCLERDIIEFLDANGWEAWRTQSGKLKVRGGWMQLAPEGTSDVIGFNRRTGQIIAVERKKPGEEISAKQWAFLERVQRAGGIGVVAVCLEDVQDAI